VRHQVAIISLKGRSLSALAELSSLGGPSDTEDSFRNALQSLSRCAVELRWRCLEIITFHPPTLPFRREKQMDVCTAPLIFARCVDGIDSIATGHWTIEFRVRFSVVCKGIRKMTT